MQLLRQFPPSYLHIHNPTREGDEAVAVEIQVDYFFRLGLRNSSQIDIPAGSTIFNSPVIAPLLDKINESQSVQLRQSQVDRPSDYFGFGDANEEVENFTKDRSPPMS